MADVLDPRHEALVEHLFRRACFVLEMPGYELKPLRRRVRGRGKLRSLRLGYTRIGSKEITIDLYTPRTMQPRQLDAILRVVAHELAHHQEPPRIVRHWFRLRREIHHPQFWKQVKKNVELLAKDSELAPYFA
ncbi:hypothetical protein KBC59_01840 [Patescibacteria group bacterium]|jgi:hypothetical protein|nr:hypothetical protein [Patescibacteria group bacterium]